MMQRVVVVSSSQRYRQRVLETALDPNYYDLVFVESMHRAYSQIRRIAPSIVIICLEIDDPDACELLSMLKVDRSTSRIRVVTCLATCGPGQWLDDDWGDSSQSMPTRTLAVPMN